MRRLDMDAVFIMLRELKLKAKAESNNLSKCFWPLAFAFSFLHPKGHHEA
jgi:hypothetical protein